VLLLQLGDQRRRLRKLCDVFEDVQTRVEAHGNDGAMVSLQSRRVLADVLQLLDVAADAMAEGAPAYMRQTFDAVWQALPFMARDIRASAAATGAQGGVRAPSLVSCVILVRRGDSLRSLAQIVSLPLLVLLRVNTQLPPRVRLHGGYPELGTPVFIPAAALRDAGDVKRCMPWPSALIPAAARQLPDVSPAVAEPLHEIPYAHAKRNNASNRTSILPSLPSSSLPSSSLPSAFPPVGSSGKGKDGPGENLEHDKSCKCSSSFPYCSTVDKICFKNATSYEHTLDTCLGNCTQDGDAVGPVTEEGYGWLHSEIGGSWAKKAAAAATGSASNDWADHLGSGHVDAADFKHTAELSAISSVARSAASASKLYAQAKLDIANSLPSNQSLDLPRLPGLEPEGLNGTKLTAVQDIEKLMSDAGGDLGGDGIEPLEEVLLQIQEQQLQQDEGRRRRQRLRETRNGGAIKPQAEAGQQVGVWAAGAAKYLEGTIKRENKDGTFQVTMKNGITNRRVPYSAIRIDPPAQTARGAGKEAAVLESEEEVGDAAPGQLQGVLKSLGIDVVPVTDIHDTDIKGDEEEGAFADGVIGTICGAEGEPCPGSGNCSGHGSTRIATEGSEPAGCDCDDGYEGQHCGSCIAPFYRATLEQAQRRGSDTATFMCNRCSPESTVSSFADISLGAVALGGVTNAACTAAAQYVVLKGSGLGLRGSLSLALTHAELKVASSQELSKMGLQVELYATDAGSTAPNELILAAINADSPENPLATVDANADAEEKPEEAEATEEIQGDAVPKLTRLAIGRFSDTRADGWSSFSFGDIPIEARAGGSYFVVLRQQSEYELQWLIGSALDRASGESHAWKQCGGEWEEERARETPRYALRLVSCHA